MDFIRQQIQRMVTEGLEFSDVHAEFAAPVRFRTSQGLQEFDGALVEAGDLEAFLLHAGAPGDWMHRVAAGGGHLDCSLDVDGQRMRCNIYRFGGTGDHGIVMRRLNGRIPALSELGLPEGLEEFMDRRAGLLLVTGPTGSGKSTTLAALIDAINMQRAYKIVTIEDPIEFLHRSQRSTIIQREVGVDVATFRHGLIASFRQDPDCVLIGEIRDRETMETALAAAEAGHLVLSTLHTSGAAKTVDRITDFFRAEEKALVRGMLSSTLIGVISQALLPRADGLGRILACEVMECTGPIAVHIREGRTHHLVNAMATAGTPRMQLLNRCLAGLVRDRVVRREDARRASYDVRDLDQELDSRETTHG